MYTSKSRAIERLFFTCAMGLAICSAFTSHTARAAKFKPPEIFILGDSQIAFGAGPTLFAFLKDFAESCGRLEHDKKTVDRLDKMNVGVMGVRSTSIHSWVAHKWVRKRMVCQPDPKWNVNARLYGWPRRRNGTYVQLGKVSDFQVCKPKRSALEVIFADKKLQPKLLVMFFMGNSVLRWANAKKKTARDVRKFLAQIPKHLPCIFMTTVPSYKKKENRLRWRAQNGIRKAFEDQGSHCTFVAGHTAQTVRAFQNNRFYFRRHKSGRVKDPYHPNKAGALKFLDLRRKALCRAIVQQVERKAKTPPVAADAQNAESEGSLALRQATGK